MNGLKQNKFLDSTKIIQADRLAWLWLLSGFLLLPFTFFQTVIPLAAWLAPLFLLRFTRTYRRPRAALTLVFLAYAAAVLIASRGLPFNFLGLLGNVLFKTPNLPYLRNQSILIDPAGRVLWTYDKNHLVPYDEAFITISGPGKLPLVETPYGRWSTAICYDTYYPALIRQAGKNNADILFAPANDSRPYAASAFAMADYRAIENGFSMIRPTGKGLPAVVDPQGRVLASQDYFTNSSGIMLASLPTHGVTTVYIRIGDTFAHLCVIGLILLMSQALFRRERLAVVTQH